MKLKTKMTNLKTTDFWKTLHHTCARLGIKPTLRIIFVCIETQTLRLFDDGNLARTYAISTSLRPPSNIKNSLGTPRGLHEISERIGDGQPLGTVFKARQPTGEILETLATERRIASAGRGEASQKNRKDFGALRSSGGCNPPLRLITTRILHLRGLEPGVNLGGDVDTHDRYIYIHGTNREDLIGTPQSSGCVVMRNLDIIDLHDQVRPGDMVLIG